MVLWNLYINFNSALHVNDCGSGFISWNLSKGFEFRQLISVELQTLSALTTLPIFPIPVAFPPVNRGANKKDKNLYKKFI